MNVAAGQFAVMPDWQDNLAQCRLLVSQAIEKRVNLLVLPEAIQARDNTDPGYSVRHGQTLNGPFIQGMRQLTENCDLTLVFTLHIPDDSGRVTNSLLALHRGQVTARYDKLHLYDAFNVQESRLVCPGQAIAPLIAVGDLMVGVMTCYDLRFPDLAMSLALAGAHVLVVPAAWLKGENKVHHWQTLLAARALDTTCYIVASGECGEKNIGMSQIIDPMGNMLACAGLEPGMIVSDITLAHVEQVRARLPVLVNRRFLTPVLG
ncbi:hydrolase [Mangrovibacter phragmitis]|uniref:Hydrolase n=1 Tax=Mangrovibacter phragmitis TaxID=1691903 RepID=A0A1B7L209_9ENTR|nr:deaminated glutathione amidase [Mangrovibacter phragmitis]OAT76195.1 hydrolase [Mangrovibacter phragmitis]